MGWTPDVLKLLSGPELLGAAQEVGKDRVGVRLTPYNSFLDAYDSQPKALMGAAVEALCARGVAYVHMVESRIKGNVDDDAEDHEVRIRNNRMASFWCMRGICVHDMRTAFALDLRGCACALNCGHGGTCGCGKALQ